MLSCRASPDDRFQKANRNDRGGSVGRPQSCSTDLRHCDTGSCGAWTEYRSGVNLRASRPRRWSTRRTPSWPAVPIRAGMDGATSLPRRLRQCGKFSWIRLSRRAAMTRGGNLQRKEFKDSDLPIESPVDNILTLGRSDQEAGGDRFDLLMPGGGSSRPVLPSCRAMAAAMLVVNKSFAAADVTAPGSQSDHSEKSYPLRFAKPSS